jgi:hypothetical protein
LSYKLNRRLIQTTKLRTPKPKDGKKYLTGNFRDYNPKKNRNNPEVPITYRSSYELLFMFKMEANNNVEWWASEQIVIPYILKELKGKEFVDTRHNYITDFTVVLRDGGKYICEVKPLAFSPKTESELRNSWPHYKNGQKWKYALQWCRNNGYTFRVINETHLKTKIF